MEKHPEKSIIKRPLYVVVSEKQVIRYRNGRPFQTWVPGEKVYAHANCSGQDVCYTCVSESTRIATVRNGFMRTRGPTQRIVAAGRAIGAFVNDSHGEKLSMD